MSGATAGVRSGMPFIVIATAFGGPEVLSVADEPVAAAGPGEAGIEVRAAGVNPVDCKVYSGAFRTPPVRGGAGAGGVVRAVGGDAIGPAGPITVGDEVIGFRVSGAYAAEL